jgi:hypothetical protein
MSENKESAPVAPVETPDPAIEATKMAHSFFVTKVSIVSLASIMVSVVAILLVSIFHPDVDNNKIFEILGPAFQTVVGCFVGMVSANFIRR